MKAGSRIVILHGTEGHPEENWFPWLKAQAEAVGIETLVPRLPTPEGQTPARWRSVFEQTIGILRREDILVGHSAGATFALHLLETAPHSVCASFFVAGFARSLNLRNRPEVLARNPAAASWDALLDPFAEHPFNWSTIRRNAGQVAVYAGDDDLYVPLQYAQELAAHLKSPLRIIPGGGHLSDSFGFVEFPQLWKEVQEILGPKGFEPLAS